MKQPKSLMQEVEENPRFFSKVKISKNCWEWGAYKNKYGYGTFRYNGKVRLAHRVSFEMFNKQIPSGLLVLHRCDNPACVNPSHLFLGTDADNVHDCISKNRRFIPKGEANSHAKLTESQVVNIINLINNGESCSEIGRLFGISRTNISDIKHGKSWKHLSRLYNEKEKE